MNRHPGLESQVVSHESKNKKTQKIRDICAICC